MGLQIENVFRQIFELNIDNYFGEKRKKNKFIINVFSLFKTMLSYVEKLSKIV